MIEYVVLSRLLWVELIECVIECVVLSVLLNELIQFVYEVIE